MKKTHLFLGLLGFLVFCLTGLYLLWHVSKPPSPYSDAARMMYRADHVYILLASLLNLLVGIHCCAPAKRGWRRNCRRLGSLMLLAGPVLFFTAFCLDASGALLPVKGPWNLWASGLLLVRERPWSVLAAGLLIVGSLLHLIVFLWPGSGRPPAFKENEGLQNVVTVLTPLDMSPRARAKLKRLLGRGPDFKKLANVHMATFVLLDHDPAGSEDFKPRLAFTAYFDGPLEGLLRPLWRLAGPWLESVYALCPDRPADGLGGEGGFQDFVLAHAVPYNTFYACYPGHRQETIRENERLHEALNQAADEGVSPEKLRSLGRSVVPRPMDIPPISPIGRLLRPMIHHHRIVLPALFLVLLALAVWLPLVRWTVGAVLAAVALFLIAVALREATETWGKASPTQVGRFPTLPDRHGGHGQLIMLLTTKPGVFRRLLLRGALALVEFGARHYFDQGDFGGLTTIHFAHLTLLDGGRRMLFISQYDGSRKGYLFDFVDRISEGLTLLGSNCVDFPRSWFMVFGGAREEDLFQGAIRQYGFAAALFYDAHEGRSSREILSHLELRKGVDRGVEGDAAVKAWLRRL